MKDPWSRLASQLLKDLMYLKRIKYKHLAKSLEALGVEENPRQLTNKINRGQFSLAFFLQCLRAMEVKGFELDWNALLEEKSKPALTIARLISSPQDGEPAQ